MDRQGGHYRVEPWRTVLRRHSPAIWFVPNSPWPYPFLATFFLDTPAVDTAPEILACSTPCTFSVSSSTRKGLATCGRRFRSRNSRVCAATISPVTNKKRSRRGFLSRSNDL